SLQVTGVVTVFNESNNTVFRVDMVPAHDGGARGIMHASIIVRCATGVSGHRKLVSGPMREECDLAQEAAELKKLAPA
ncbi:MAG TPA: hypothetical protein VIV60_03580, partial [Polyangiaceae bacterium]